MQPAARYAEAPSRKPVRDREALRDEVSRIRMAICTTDSGLPLAEDRFREATLVAERAARPGAELAAVWQAVIDGRLDPCAEGGSTGHRYLVARAGSDPSSPSRPLSRIETAVVIRVLDGQQQKVVAAELRIASSTASKWYTLGLHKMRIAGGPIPLPLVIAAQAWASAKTPPVNARSAAFEHEGAQYFVLTVPKPTVTAQDSLTASECEVARFLVEGESRSEIAARRQTSAQTVACQLRCVFAKWRLTGRCALIRRAVELGWLQ
jgi:DNA-binding NarL/FixJ family response regulator